MITDEDAALFVIDASKVETEMLDFALEFSEKQVELGSFVCGVGGAQVDQVVCGTVVASDSVNTIESEICIDSNASKTGFSGSAVGYGELFGTIQGGHNSSYTDKRRYGNLTSVEPGYQFIDGLHDIASFSPTLTRCISSSAYKRRIFSGLAAEDVKT